MQNIIILIDAPYEIQFHYYSWLVDFKVGIMGLNRFIIDEDAAFESPGVYFLQSSYSLSDVVNGS